VTHCRIWPDPASPLRVRLPVAYDGDVSEALDQVAQFAQIGALVELSLNYHDHTGDVQRWCGFIEQVVRHHGSAVGSIGITNEANLADVPFAPDGAYPNALEALVDGVLVASATKQNVAATANLGFSAAADAGANLASVHFWKAVAGRGGEAFATGLGFAGLTIYPGGFSGPPPTTEDLIERIGAALNSYRTQLASAGIPRTVPIRVTEFGWPTGPGRSEADQAEILATIINTIAGLSAEIGVSHLELFALRDADSATEDTFGHFGVLRDDYTPKLAYHVLRTLIQTHGAP
jgi:hypothetical protein